MNTVKDPPKLVLDLMRDTFEDKFKAYFLGAPTMLPEAAYPCCIVQFQKSTNTVTGAPSGHDNVGELITVHFLENSKDDMGASDEEETTIRRIYNYVQGRDPATGYYKHGTAMYALRMNLDLQTVAQTGHQTVIDHDIDTDYEVTPRPDQPAIVEAIVTIVTRERVRVQRT